jgi:DNA-binding NarL/FixJ family response regulator
MGGGMRGQDIRLLLVGEHRLLMEALQLALASRGLTDVHLADSREPAGVLGAVAEHSPQLVLVDLDGGESSWDATVIGRLADRGLPVVALVGTGDVYFVGEALEAGADCIFHKAGSVERLVQVIDDTAAGRPTLLPAARDEFLAALGSRRTSDRARFAPLGLLSRREGEVLALLAAGTTAEEIASSAFVSLTTVRTQIRAILHKLGVRSQLAAVAIARDAGWSVGDGAVAPKPDVDLSVLGVGHHSERNSEAVSSMLTMRS